MTLRRTLLTAFVILGLVPSIALSWLSFSRTRDAMTAQIRASLAVQARGLQADIDAMLFERVQNALEWRRSELMQDLRVGDVDKRVSNYLAGLQAGYGDVYDSIDCVADDGLVVASSTPARLGTRRRAEAGPVTAGPGPGQGPGSGPGEAAALLAAGAVRLSWPEAARLDEARPFVLASDVPSPYAGPQEKRSRLVLELAPRQLDRLLDAAAVGRRVVVVVDAQGRWVAGSAAVRARPMPDALARAAALAAARGDASEVDARFAGLAGEALVGRAASASAGARAGAGWTTIVLEPVDEALAPVAQMGRIFIGLLASVLLATALVATWLAGAIARPLVALTQRTRRFRQGEPAAALPAPAPASGIAELDVLSGAFDEMVRAIEHSRRELVRTSKMAMLGELGAVLAHEVRTPLGIIRSSAQVLKRSATLDAEGRELLSFIESETDRLNGLVAAMLDTARPRAPSVARCDVHALLSRCAHMHDLRRGGARPVMLALAASDGFAAIDEEQVTAALLNLLNNASQAAGPAGRIELATFDDGPDHLGVRVSDDGPGIPDHLLDRVFDPFVTGREGGIGLGLAVVRQVVAAHGGEITAGRGAWGGASFTLRLPRRPPRASTESTP